MGKESMDLVVAVLGPSHHDPQDRVYQEAEELGRLLCQNGCYIRSGGGSGVMEAVSKGFLESGGTPSAFLLPGQKGNIYLRDAAQQMSYFRRLERLLLENHAVIIIPGSSGTSVELVAALHVFSSAERLGYRGLFKKSIIIMTKYADEFSSIKVALKALSLSDDQINLLDWASNGTEAIKILTRYLEQWQAHQE